MDDGTVDDVIQFIEKRINDNPLAKKLNISWFGGEPLLALDVIEKISLELVNFSAKKGLVYSSYIVTNGFLLTKPVATRLFEQCKITGAQITVDGNEQYYCTQKQVTPTIFHQVLGNISEVSSILSLSIRINITKDNVKDAYALYDFFNKQGLLGKIMVYVAIVRNYSGDKEDDCYYNINDFSEWRIKFYNEIKNNLGIDMTEYTSNCRYRKTSCVLIRAKNAVIGVDGELYCCEHDVGIKEKIVGDCKNGLYHNTYHTKVFTMPHKNKCLNCKAFPLCLGGCFSERSKFDHKAVSCKYFMQSLRRTLIKFIQEGGE